MSKNRIVLFDNIVAARLADMTYTESEATAEAIAKKAINSYQQLGHDDVSLIFGSKGITLPLGGQLRIDDRAPASLTVHPLDSIDQVEQLDFSAAFFDKNERGQQLYRAAQMIDDAIGQECQIRFSMSAPYSLAAQMLSPEKMMRASLKSKDKVHHFIQQLMEIQVDIIEAFTPIESLIFHLSDPMASTDLISPKLYRDFAEPYCRQLIDHIHGYGKEVTLHICGDTTKILESMLATGADVLSLDQVVDLGAASQLIGSQAAILGNIDPVRYLRDGRPDQVSQHARMLYDQVGHHPGGFILGPGCDIPYDAPEENLQAMVAVAQS